MVLDMLHIWMKQIDIANYYGMPKTRVSSIIICGRVQKQEETRLF